MTFDYELIRTRRKTFSVAVSSDNKITVRCPLRASVREVESFLECKSGWIESRIKKNKLCAEEFADVINYDKILVKGERYNLRFGGVNYIGRAEVGVKSFACLKKVFVGFLGGEFEDRFNKLSTEIGLKASGTTFKDYKSRWGCCDRFGKITFNYKLLMLPEDVQNYVIVHELCHTLHMNHSKKFYSAVESAMPYYRSYANILKKYAFIARLY